VFCSRNLAISTLLDTPIESLSCCVQTNIIGATASDRNILLYDTRGSAPLRKVVVFCWLCVLTAKICHYSVFLCGSRQIMIIVMITVVQWILICLVYIFCTEKIVSESMFHYHTVWQHRSCVPHCIFFCVFLCCLCTSCMLLYFST